MNGATDASGPRFLGLDFGTESVRALLVDGLGHIDATAVAPYASGQITRGAAGAESRFDAPLPASWALQDPGDWLAGAATAVRAAIADAAVDPAAVEGIGVDFTSCTVLPARADGTPLAATQFADRPHAWPKLWKHHGAQAQATRLTEVARERGEPWLDRYGGIVGLEWSFPKLLEVLDEDPAIIESADVWLEGGDWFVWQLTGAPSLGGDRNASDLVRSTCQAGYKALWSRAGGFPDGAYLDACRPGFAAAAARLLVAGSFRAPGEPAGALSAAAAELLGLRPGTPVSAAVIDAHAGVPGAGVGGTGTLVMVLGTSGCHMIMDPAEHRIPGVSAVVADGILPGAFGYETGQAAVGDAFEWVRRLCGAPDHATLEAAAREVTPGAEGLVSVDWFNGCRTPLMDGDLTGALLGLTLQHGPGHLYRSVLEASACGLAWIVDTLREGGVAVDRFVATGGLPGQNRLFGDIVAAVLGATVEVSTVEHGPALGAAVLGAAAAGEFASVGEAVDSMAGTASAISAPRRIDPDPSDVGAYLAVVERYHSAANVMRGASLPALTTADASAVGTRIGAAS